MVALLLTGLIWFFRLVALVTKLIPMLFHQLFLYFGTMKSVPRILYREFCIANLEVCIAINNIDLIKLIKNYLRFFIWIIDDKFLDCLSCRVLGLSLFRVRIWCYTPCYNIAQNDVLYLSLPLYSINGIILCLLNCSKVRGD